MKRMKNLTVFFAIAAAAIAVSSCQLIGLGSAKPEAAKGSIRISIPHLAPWLAASMPKTANAVSRAFLYASKVKVDVQEETFLGSEVWNSVVTPGMFGSVSSGPSSTTLDTMSDIPIGSAYKVVVSVYNALTDELPVVEGSEYPVEITAGGETPVTVTCFPVGIDAIDLSSAIMITTKNGTLAPNAEAWYKLTFASGKQYTATLVSGSGITGYVFGSDGVYAGDTFSVGSPITVPVAVTGDYYIGLASSAAGDYQLNVAAGAVSPVDPSVSISYPSANSEITQGSSLSPYGDYDDPQGVGDVASILVEVLNTDESSTGVSSSVGNFTMGTWNLSALDTSTLAVGSYFLRAYVEDAETNWAYSMLTPISIVSGETAPTANAGIDQSVAWATQVYLNGSDSAGTNLSYSWSFQSKPLTSTTAALGSTTIVNPQFFPDVPGAYMLRLTVTNGLGSNYDDVTITVAPQNQAPIPIITPSSSSIESGTSVTLDSSTSYDADGTVTGWTWYHMNSDNTIGTLIGTEATFSETLNATTIYGLRVKDNLGLESDIVSLTITVTAKNNPPIAVISASMTEIATGGSVTLYGTESYDPEGQSLRYYWYLNGTRDVNADNCSSYSWTLTEPTLFQLVVFDVPSGLESNMAEVTVTVTPPQATVTIGGY